MTFRVFQRRASSRGFTLIEVLATLVVIAIVIPATMKGISIALAQASLARHSVEAASLAETKLSELMAEASYQAGASAGDFGPDLPDYRWAAESAVRDVDLNEIIVHVYWQSRGQERSISLSTLVYTAIPLQGATQQGTAQQGATLP